MVGRGRDGDRVEGRAVGHTEAPVADPHLDASVPRLVERPAGARGEGRDPLDRDDARDQFVEHRRGVARARADVEQVLGAVEREELAHRRDDEGLRDRLVLADRERCVLVRDAGEVRRDERLARHTGHRGEHALVGDPPAPELALHHAGAAGVARPGRRVAHAARRSV